MVKPLMQRYQPLTVVKWVFTLAIPMVAIFGFYDISQVQWTEIPLSIYFAISYVVIGVTVMAYLLNAWALKSVNASIVGIYIYIQPVLATLIAVTFGKDELTITKGIFALLIFMGVYLVSIRK
jgi:drug/metabolite transporter (DMT)-like permease